MNPHFDFEKPIIELETKISELRNLQQSGGVDIQNEILKLEKKLDKLVESTFTHLNSWQRTQLSRHPNRPYFLDYVPELFDDFVELHGDRNFADDQSIIIGLAKFNTKAVAVVAHQKGRSTKDKIARNFGMPKPEGYRKALRMMSMAERFKLPILTFIDTPGAYPGIDAEERGQAEAIAKNILVMAGLKTPILSVVLGEGGSGGALAIGVANVLLMLENSTYSVISPESCAAILFRDAAKAPQAAKSLKLTAKEIFHMNIADEIIAEPSGGAHRNMQACAKQLKISLIKHLDQLCQSSGEQIVQHRYLKYRQIGTFLE